MVGSRAGKWRGRRRSQALEFPCRRLGASTALPAVVLISGLTLNPAPAAADGGASGSNATYPRGGFVSNAGQDNPNGPGGPGGAGWFTRGGGGGGAGYPVGGEGGIGAQPGGLWWESPFAKVAGGKGANPPNPAQNGNDWSVTGGGGGGGAHGYGGSALGLLGAFLTGTNGGNGGNASGGNVQQHPNGLTIVYDSGGGGGAGGYGAVVTSGAFTNITRDVTGGNGGDGGTMANATRPNVPRFSFGASVCEIGGSGGSGGIGLLFTNPAGSDVEIAANVKGGAGGSPGAPHHPFTTPGAGGVGISGQNLQIVMQAGGTVAGGLSGNGVRAPAIQFTGGVNSLTIQNGATIGAAITGQVLAFSQKDSLVLNSGASSSSFFLGLLNSQFVNFGQVIKAGPSTWNITGAGSGPALNIQSGTLNLVGANWKIATNSMNSGALSVGAGSVLSTLGLFNNVTIQNNGTVQGFLSNGVTFNNNASGVFSGTLTNALGTTNNYGAINGSITISGGTVKLERNPLRLRGILRRRSSLRIRLE